MTAYGAVLTQLGAPGFRVLGPVEVWSSRGEVPAGSPRQRAVLAALLVDAGRPVPVDVLVNRVWGEDAPDRAPRTLHTYITRLRRIVDQVDTGEKGAARLLRCSGGYLLDAHPDQVDLHRFGLIVAQARDPSCTPRRRLALLRAAMGLWRGQPLTGVDGEWAERMRRSWEQQHLDAVVAWAQAELLAGEPSAVYARVRDLVDQYPLIEPLAAVLMQALAADGRTAEALNCYAAVSRQLAEELGADPGPALQGVHRALLRGEYAPPEPPALTVAPAESGRDAPPTSRPARRSRGRWTVAALMTAVVLLLAWHAAGRPSRSGGGHLARGAQPGTSASRGATDPPRGWVARTAAQAPLFAPSGELIRTLPAGSPLDVKCWYPGNPPRQWRTDGIEYHVSVPADGHVPDPYVVFDDKPPTGLPRCPPRAPAIPASPSRA